MKIPVLCLPRMHVLNVGWVVRSVFLLGGTRSCCELYNASRHVYILSQPMT